MTNRCENPDCNRPFGLASAIQLALRAILLDQVLRELQTSAGTKQSLLEMAVQMPRTVCRGAEIVRRWCSSKVEEREL
jgi:hypothetical protein